MLGRTPPAPLTDYPGWKLRYSSDQDNLVTQFYEPALAAAKYYDRAVGYFSLSALAVIGQALEPFWDHGERMRIVASVRIQERDVDPLTAGYKKFAARQEANDAVHEAALRLEVGQYIEDFAEPIKLVTSFIEVGLLKLYIATGLRDGGAAFYHEKIGVMIDHRGNFVTFEGSPNETRSGLSSNIESFPVHRSWVTGEHGHAFAARQAIDGLLGGEPQRNVQVVPFPQAQAEKLLETYTPERPSGRSRTKRRTVVTGTGHAGGNNGGGEVVEDSEPRMPIIPGEISLHDYQEEAVLKWQEEDGRGRFEMATGTGKTITALAAAVRACEAMAEEDKGLLVVVVVPDNALVRQWKAEAENFGFRPITSNQAGWKDKVTDELDMVRFGYETQAMVIATVDSVLSGERYFLHQIKQFGGEGHQARRMLIADEAHSYGAPTYREVLLEEFEYRLGLTATFERHFDEEGTRDLDVYFAGSKAEVSMHDAIHVHKSLVPYNFYPQIVELTEEEVEAYAAISDQISQVYSRVNSGSGTWYDFEQIGESLLRKRANILKHASDKISKVREVIEALPEKKYLLIYAAEGEGPVTGTRQEDQLLDLVRRLGLEVAGYDGGTPDNTRRDLEERLDEGSIDALVAMRCLDQGIDIPEARTALFVASTTNPRQYVQRRGRVLRRPKRPTSTKDSADLYDFIVVPPELDDQRFEMEQKLVAREVLRASTLAESAENRYGALDVLASVVERYGLTDVRL